MLNMYFCCDCMEKLVKWGEPAVIAYEMICENYVRNDGHYIILSNDVHFSQEAMIQMVDFLEKKGFVMSTEHEDSFIKVKPMGHNNYEGNDLFCPMKCKDWSKEEEWIELFND